MNVDFSAMEDLTGSEPAVAPAPGGAPQELRFLLLENDPEQIASISDALKQGSLACSLHPVASGSEFATALQRGGWHAVLADYQTALFTGRQALEMTRWCFPHLPFLILSSAIPEELAVEALKQGANDFVSKERLGRLVPAIRRALHDAAAQNRQQVVEAQLQLKHAALQAASNGIIITDRKGIILWTNPAFAQLTGYSPEETLGRNPNFLKSGKHDKAFYAEMWNTILAGKTWHGQLINRRKDASLYDEEITITPYRAQGEEISHFFAVKQDISERKRHETEMQKAKVAAEKASQAKSEFLANMSHEIRTPMNGILISNNLLMETPLTAEQKEYQGIIKSSGEALLSILNDILDFSKIEAGRLELEIIDFALMTLLADTLPPLEIQARQKGLGFVCEIDPDTPEHLRGDPSRLRQIIVNLVGNSVKFTQRGEIRIRIASTRSTEDGGPVRLNLDFSDTGIGISTSKIATVFEPFTQADSSVTRCYGGTGLGLAIVHSLVKLMHGGITLESQEGKGSVFHVALQFENARSMPAPKMSPSLLPSLTNEPRPALDILLVEDNLLNQRMVCRLLELHGHSVSTAGDGLAALEAYHTKSFDLILMDVHMPELDGFAVTAKIRDLEKVNSRKTPIVAMTAKAMRGDREACLQAGMDEYLSKPLRPEELWTVLDRFGRPPHRAPLPNSGAEKKPHVPDNSLFDEKTALARVEGNRELFVELIGIFLSEWPQIQKKIKIAMGSCDWTSLQMHLHNAKGLTANLGSAAAASAAKEAESRVKARRLEGLDLAVEQVFQSVENLRSALFQAFPEALQLEKPGV